MVRRFVQVVCASLALVGSVGGWVNADVTLNGAGASFPKPMYDKFIAEYNRIKPEVKINYNSVGSGAGIKQISEGTIDFAGSDAAMSDKQLAEATGGKIIHIPTVMGAVVPVYNIEGVNQPVKFTGPVLADIFLGKISKWNDPKLAEANQGVKLPDTSITVVHRSDGSGTTAVFTDYLSKVSPEWKSSVGTGTSVKWIAPGAMGGKGNEQVAATVQKTPGAIGYVELIYALENKIPFGQMQNKAGKFVSGSIETVSAAARDLKDVPADMRLSITNADGEDAYPISAWTYILLYQNQKDAEKGKALVDFLTWVTHDGQALASQLHYAPLPKSLESKIDSALASVNIAK